MTEAVLALLLLMVSVFVGLNNKISQGMKTGYFVFILIVVMVIILLKLIWR